ncbi:MAG: hypothetical protein KKA73_04920, partial [Chloroflexi bacterium]|nr:hypothetical protein [Chloroflexota bacterium]
FYVVPITATMTPTSTFYICTPAAQATWTLGTSGIAAGTELIVYNTAAQDLIIAHTNMLSSSGAALTINQYDLAAFIFNGTSWVEMYLIANS